MLEAASRQVDAMTEAERLALKLMERYLRAWSCRHCGKAWLSGRSQVALIHRCSASTPSPRWDPRTPRERVHDDRIAWARSQLGMAVEDALGDRAFLDVGDDQ